VNAEARGVHRLIGACGALFLLTALLGPAAAAQTPRPETLTLTLEVPPYELVHAADGTTLVRADGCGAVGAPGRATLPHCPIDVALPPQVIWSSLSLDVRDVQLRPLPGTHRLRTGVPDRTSSGVVAASPTTVPDAPSSVRIATVGQLRRWRFARLDYTPFQYDPATGQLRVVERVTLELRFVRSGEFGGAALPAETVPADGVAGRFVNYETARRWYPQADAPGADAYDYVIVTTNAIVANSTMLDDFVAHKQARGHSVLVVTEDDYDGLTGTPPNGRAERVRQWLIDHYQTVQIEHVLLVGDPTPEGTGPTSLPMKLCWPYSSYDVPTDYFFADLTGDWDPDGDALYGEWEDFTAWGGVDLTPEVYVGRIPFYGNYADLDHILAKTMDYESEANGGWQGSALLPMGFQASGSYDGASLGQQMLDDYLIDAGFSTWRQYQQGSGACGLDSTYPSEEELRGGTVVRDRWAANAYGLVVWWGHGSATSTAVGYGGCWDGTLFDSTQTGALDDDRPAFTYQCSCENGHPEHPGNLQYAILRHGGVATVGAARLSWFNTGEGYGYFSNSTTNAGIGYEYVLRVIGEYTAGQALYEAKASMTPPWETRLMNYYDFNLYGDPALRFVPPCVPVSGVELQGPPVVAAGETWTYRAVPEPLGASLPITYTWHDGTYGPSLPVSWTVTGTHALTVTAVNPCDGELQADSMQVRVLAEWPGRVYLPLVGRLW
jgi:hypothetical protein